MADKLVVHDDKYKMPVYVANGCQTTETEIQMRIRWLGQVLGMEEVCTQMPEM